MNSEKMILAVDFDGTLSLDAEWPELGRPNIGMFELLKKKKEEGAYLILWTCRNGKDLEEAVEYCRKHGIEFDAVNESLPWLIQKYDGDTRKIYADYYLDDKAINPFFLEKYREILEEEKAEEKRTQKGIIVFPEHESLLEKEIVKMPINILKKGSCKEFKKVFAAVKKIEKQKTFMDVDMAAGYLMGETEEKARQRKLTKEQKKVLLEIIENAWQQKRKELERKVGITQ